MSEPLDPDALERYWPAFNNSASPTTTYGIDLAEKMAAELRATRAERDEMRDDYYNAIGAWRSRAERSEAATSRVEALCSDAAEAGSCWLTVSGIRAALRGDA